MRNRRVFRARREDWNGGIALAIGERDGAGNVSHRAQTITFEPIEPNEDIPDWIRLSHDDAQALVDELWLCGIRPSEGTGSAGSLAATERHLADMRRIAFAALREPYEGPTT